MVVFSERGGKKNKKKYFEKQPLTPGRGGGSAFPVKRPPVGARFSLGPPPGSVDPNAELMAAVQAYIEKYGGGGGGGGLSAGEQMAIDREQARLLAEESARDRGFRAGQDKLGRQFQAQEEAKNREFDRQKQVADLRAQRQATYVDLLGRDPARAYLFALGLGPEHDVFTTEAGRLGATLEPLAGAVKTAKGGEQALSRLLGAPVTLGKYGVQGLGTPESASKAYVQGTPDVQRLLASAFGVGSTAPGAQPGISPETLAQLIQAVVPTGARNVQ